MQIRHIIIFACGLAILAACGGGKKRGIETLGPVFTRAFDQGPNATPLDISNAGLQVRLRQDPFSL